MSKAVICPKGTYCTGTITPQLCVGIDNDASKVACPSEGSYRSGVIFNSVCDETSLSLQILDAYDKASSECPSIENPITCQDNPSEYRTPENTCQACPKGYACFGSKAILCPRGRYCNEGTSALFPNPGSECDPLDPSDPLYEPEAECDGYGYYRGGAIGSYTWGSVCSVGNGALRIAGLVNCPEILSQRRLGVFENLGKTPTNSSLSFGLTVYLGGNAVDMNGFGSWDVGVGEFLRGWAYSYHFTTSHKWLVVCSS